MADHNMADSNMATDQVKTAQYTLLICTLAAFLAPFMGSAVNLALVDIQTDLNGNQVLLTWLVTVFILTSAALLLPFGRLADLAGRRDLFIAGLTAFGAASLACGLAPSMGWLLFFRIIQGVGGAIMAATNMAILTAAFPMEKRGHVLGINAASVYSGLALGPVLGGVMTHWLGWRSIFVSVGILTVPAALAALMKMPADRRPFDTRDYDKAGALVIALSLTLLIYGASTWNSHYTGPWLTAAGGAGLVLFAGIELRALRPILDVRIFKHNPVFLFSNLAALLNYCATFAVNYLMSLYLLTIKGLDSQQAGFLMLVQPVLMTVVSPLAGRLSDRFRPRVIAAAGMAMTAAGTYLLTFISADTEYTAIIALFVLLGTGFGLFASPNNNAVMSSVEKPFYGVASSTLGSMRTVGQSLSMAVVAYIFARNLGPVQVGPEVAPQLLSSIHTAFIIFTVLCLLGIMASFVHAKQPAAKA